ncbi:hypothetical protein K7432_000824 [Basidiobolus ranarum]|uniref:C2H2-type domain-containing protein n=1 Tax=Basidiobolus ranarum TaxID=34480 RepID=A0ABR2X3X0_9FUNG
MAFSNKQPLPKTLLNSEIFPLIIEHVDQIDIFGTLLALKPYEAVNSTFSTPFKSTVLSAPSTPTARSSPAVTSSPSSGKFFCEPCRKSFGSEATWLTHQNSSKHLQNIKNQKKNSKTPKKNNPEIRKKAEALSPNPRSTTSPQVAEALLNEKQAKKVAAVNPVMAASVFWNVSKVLWANSHARDTYNSLENLVYHLEQTIESATEQQEEQLIALLPKLAATLYLARMALARLIYYYSEDKYLACTIAHQAVEEKFGLPSSELNDIIQTVNLLPIDELFRKCTTVIEDSNASLKNTKDPNLTLSDVLSEVAGFYCNHIDKSSEESCEQTRSLQHCSVVLYVLSSIIYTKQERMKDYIQTLGFLEQIYHHLEHPWYASDIMLLSIKSETTPIKASDEDKLQDTTQDLDFPNLWWKVCNALLIALEISKYSP